MHVLRRMVEAVEPGGEVLDLQVIRPGIEALNLGPIEVRDVEGRLLSGP